VVDATPATAPTDVIVSGPRDCIMRLEVEGASTSLNATGSLAMEARSCLDIDQATVFAETGVTNATVITLLGAGATLAVGTSATIVNDGLIVAKAGSGATLDGDVISNPGATICSESGATLTFTGSFLDMGTLTIGAPTCPGCREERGGVGLVTIGPVTLDPVATLSVEEASWRAEDDWDVAIDDPSRFALVSGSLLFSNTDTGDALDVECLAADVGADVSLGNPELFAIGVMTIDGEPGVVRLVDQQDNTPGPGREALYVDHLVLDPGATLDLNGSTLYYGTVSPTDPYDPGSGVTIFDSEGGGMLGQIDVLGIGSASAVPQRVELRAVRPNPFTREASVSFGLPSREQVRVRVYDVGGRLVRDLADGVLPAGWHVVTWDGRSDGGTVAPAGLYFCLLETSRERRTRKLAFLPGS
jgi:hypothetical protein